MLSQYVVTRHNCVLSKQPNEECKPDINDKENDKVKLQYDIGRKLLRKTYQLVVFHPQIMEV